MRSRLKTFQGGGGGVGGLKRRLSIPALGRENVKDIHEGSAGSYWVLPARYSAFTIDGEQPLVNAASKSERVVLKCYLLWKVTRAAQMPSACVCVQCALCAR